MRKSSAGTRSVPIMSSEIERTPARLQGESDGYESNVPSCQCDSSRILRQDRDESPVSGISDEFRVLPRKGPLVHRAPAMPSEEASSGLMSISRIQFCSSTSWLNRTRRRSSAPQCLRVCGHARLSVPWKSVLCSMNRRARVVFSGGKASARSSEDLHKLPSGAEQKHRPELCVHARTDDQFVSFRGNHPLHRHAVEVLCAPACQ